MRHLLPTLKELTRTDMLICDDFPVSALPHLPVHPDPDTTSDRPVFIRSAAGKAYLYPASFDQPDLYSRMAHLPYHAIHRSYRPAACRITSCYPCL